ncbi:hypothetical protein BDR26DRAFT_934573 [Obelidium mucronatum]|nr:hypothetical protein BDR26DRAFT_934573 [Obelidium mucronatum]
MPSDTSSDSDSDSDSDDQQDQHSIAGVGLDADAATDLATTLRLIEAGLARERAFKGRASAAGVVVPATGLAHVERPVGAAFSSVGRASEKGASGSLLRAEEALFLLERGALLLHAPETRAALAAAVARFDAAAPGGDLNSVCAKVIGALSLQEAYALLLADTDTGCSLPQYQVYAFLKRAGYIVFRHESQCLEIPQQPRVDPVVCANSDSKLPDRCSPSTPLIDDGNFMHSSIWNLFGLSSSLSSFLLEKWKVFQSWLVPLCFAILKSGGRFRWNNVWKWLFRRLGLMLWGLLWGYSQTKSVADSSLKSSEPLPATTTTLPPVSLKPDFEVYKPNAKFKKSERGIPDYYIIVVSGDDEVPSPDALDSLFQLAQSNISKVPEIKVAIVEQGRVSFVGIKDSIMDPTQVTLCFSRAVLQHGVELLVLCAGVSVRSVQWLETDAENKNASVECDGYVAGNATVVIDNADFNEQSRRESALISLYRLTDALSRLQDINNPTGPRTSQGSLEYLDGYIQVAAPATLDLSTIKEYSRSVGCNDTYHTALLTLEDSLAHIDRIVLAAFETVKQGRCFDVILDANPDFEANVKALAEIPELSDPVPNTPVVVTAAFSRNMPFWNMWIHFSMRASCSDLRGTVDPTFSVEICQYTTPAKKWMEQKTELGAVYEFFDYNLNRLGRDPTDTIGANVVVRFADKTTLRGMVSLEMAKGFPLTLMFRFEIAECSPPNFGWEHIYPARYSGLKIEE